MRRRSMLVLTVAIVGVLSMVMSQSPAASAYQMEGGGFATFETEGSAADGIPFNPADTTTVNKMNFASFPIGGSGVLLNNNVAGSYLCSGRTGSGLSPITTAFNAGKNPDKRSQVVGGAMTYKLTFVWQCEKQSAVAGPQWISGYFSNDPSLNSANVAGVPVFRGVFTVSTTATPPSQTSADGLGGSYVAMTCLGGFAPANPNNAGGSAGNFQNQRVVTATFGGECTAVAP